MKITNRAKRATTAALAQASAPAWTGSWRSVESLGARFFCTQCWTWYATKQVAEGALAVLGLLDVGGQLVGQVGQAVHQRVAERAASPVKTRTAKMVTMATATAPALDLPPLQRAPPPG